MNKYSNEELQLSLPLASEPDKRMSDQKGLSTLRQIFTVGTLALVVLLILFGNENVSGKMTADEVMYNDRRFSSAFDDLRSTDKSGEFVSFNTSPLIDSQLMAYTAKLLSIDLSEENNRAEFLAVPYLSSEDKQAILAGFEQGTKSVGVIYVRDNLSQDGDIIQIVADGLTMDIPLTHEPSLIFLPFASGESLIFRGMRDGGDGIAATVETLSGTVSLPVLAMGETIELPVR